MRAAAAALLLAVLAGCGSSQPPPPATPGGGTGQVPVAPWLDVTAWPVPDVAAVARGGVRTLNLGFVTAAGGGCRPSWGGTVPIDAPQVMGLIRTFRSGGGDVRVSFGGAEGVELARACPSPTALAAAYGQVVDTLGVRLVDLDVEGTTLADTAATRRRDEALRRLAADAEARGRPLRITYTLPVETTGLTQAAQQLLQDAHDAGVPVDAVDVLAMDYAPGPGDLVAAAADAVDASARFVARLWPEHAVRLAATAMIGVNDVPGQVLSPAQARQVAELARSRGLAWLGFWSLGRDRPCPGSEEVPSARPGCSGVAQRPGAYLAAFTRAGPAPGTAPAR